MKRSGAELVVFALEQIGVTHTFGIPGVHNTEIYDELGKSRKIKPILVTHEGNASFIADAISRTSDKIGTLVIVPAAGMTHALSGIGEAFLAGVPMLIISGGIRRDTDKVYQLHQIEQNKIVHSITKAYYLIKDHQSIIPIIYEAYRLATSGEPGPVFIEVPVNIQLFQSEVDYTPIYKNYRKHNDINLAHVQNAVKLLSNASKPGIFVGWGARDAKEELMKLSDILVAPVATTLQGISVFPANHPFHTGMGFGNYSNPSGDVTFHDCDCLITIGARFAEIPTGSYGMNVPKNLIHIDINPEVFHKNYPATVTIEGDSKEVLTALLHEFSVIQYKTIRKADELGDTIKKAKSVYLMEWINHNREKYVNPSKIFMEIRKALDLNDILVTDDGNHTFLAAELYPIYESKCFISPSDFNAMGYCVPAAIGAKIANPNKIVVGIVGDGAFLMTGLELITAKENKIGVVIFVFNDGQLAQISQGQQAMYNRTTATTLGKYKVEGIAIATGSHYLKIERNNQIEAIVKESIEISKTGTPVIIDVNIDYSKKTRFTNGVVKTNLLRFSLKEKIRFISRAVFRKFTG